jgi:hypothetical protein
MMRHIHPPDQRIDGDKCGLSSPVDLLPFPYAVI